MLFRCATFDEGFRMPVVRMDVGKGRPEYVIQNWVVSDYPGCSEIQL